MKNIVKCLFYVLLTLPISLGASAPNNADCKDAPQIYCIQGIKVSISPSGVSIVFPEDFVSGVYDDCTPNEKLEYVMDINPTILKDKPSNNAVQEWKIDCNDIGSHEVIIWVMDEHGNWSFCSLKVEVEDSQVYTECPSDITIHCAESVFDFNVTGFAKAYTSCKKELEVKYEDHKKLEECEEGVVTRVWGYIDPETNTIEVICEQTINYAFLTEDDIIWPEELTIFNCDLDPNKIDPNEYSSLPQLTSGLCETQHLKYEDEVFPDCNNQFLILRNWAILDWCTGSTFEHTQEINLVCNKNYQLNCNDHVNISIGPNGKVVITVDMLIEEYNEACALGLIFSYSLDEGPFQESLRLGCDDLGTHKITIMVENEFGEIDFCIVEITLEDKGGFCNKKLKNEQNQTRNTGTKTDNLKTIQVYPNPIYNVVNIEINVVQKESAFVHIYDNQGRKVYTLYILENGQQTLSIDKSEFNSNSSILFLEVFDGSKTYNKKVMVTP